MVEVIRSVTSLSWSMALFGARQIGGLLAADIDRVGEGFDVLAGAGSVELSGTLGRVFTAGETVQVESVERLFSFLSPCGSDSVNNALAVFERSAAALRGLPGNAISGQELVNKVRSVREFRRTGPSIDANAPLASLTGQLARARALGAYRGLWATEGLGFALAENVTEAPSTLLRRTDLPHAARIPLHTGFGLSLAMRTLGPIDRWSDDSTLRTSLQDFVDQCESQTAPDHSMMAFEALGFVVRSLYPGLLLRVDRLLTALDSALVGYYWHGVGRGLYFLPSQLPLASAAWRRALDNVRCEAPHAEGRRNALAGFAWALTLVNIEHPEVIANFVKEHLASLDEKAFSHGVSSALVVWSRANGRDVTLRNFLDHRPEIAVMQPWLACVSRPGDAAVRIRSSPDQASKLGTIFHVPPEGGTEALDPAVTHPSVYPLGAIAATERSFNGWLARAFQALSRRARAGSPFSLGDTVREDGQGPCGRIALAGATSQEATRQQGSQTE